MQLDFVPLDTPDTLARLVTRRPGSLAVIEETDRYIRYANANGLQFTLLK